MSERDEARKRATIGVFDRAASAYDQVGPRFFAHFGQRLVEKSRICPGTIVLDVAAGRGAILYPAAQRVGRRGRVVGTDLSMEMVEKTAAEIRDGGWQNIEMLNMDAEELRFPDASFDSVFCGFSLWFFSRPQKALEEFLRVLKPGGLVALSTWSQDCPFVSWCIHVGREYLPPKPGSAPPPSHFDTAPVLDAALRQAGFEDVDIHADEAEFGYTNEEEFWQSLWSHGIRRFFERLEESALPAVKADVLKKAQIFRTPDGIRTPMRALFATGHKPGK